MKISQEIVHLFKQICLLQDDGLTNFLANILRESYDNVIVTKDYILAEGDIPIALCAHMDTVAKIPLRNIFYDEKETVMWSPELLGADDRAGVFALLWIVFNGYKPTIIFTNEEEVGGVGAKALVRDYPKSPFGNFKAIIEIDRQGSRDAVYYFCDNRDFENYISSFGFKTAYGTFTDISVIAPEWGCAAVNLSAGYYNEHFVNEYVNLSELMETIAKVECILEKQDLMPYFEYIPLKVETYSYFKKPGNVCEICLKKFQKKEKRKMAYGMTVCNDCFYEYCI